MARAVATIGALLLTFGIGTLSLANEAQPEPSKDAGTEGPPKHGFAPDPPPLVTKHQWKLELVYRQGEVQLRKVQPVVLEKPVVTARRMGRFAVELYVGKELVERVRFDFPLLGADDFAGQKRPREAPPSFEQKLTTRTSVMIPQSERATRARLLDRATGKTLELPWPFEEADAGQPAP